ncbi:flagellar biosynthetic protein FliO [bacterium]|nr:flagellar biosynthetic protein FliO [bacterium]
MRHRERIIILLTAIAILFVESGVGQVSPKQVAPKVEETSPVPTSQFQTPARVDINPFSLLFKALAIVLVFSLALYLLLRLYRYLSQGKRIGGQSLPIRVVSSSVIGPKKSLCVVDVLDHVLVLGVTDAQISVLLEIPADKINESHRSALLPENQSSRPNFNLLLKNWINHRNASR